MKIKLPLQTIILCSALILVGCYKSDRQDLERALTLAGDNRQELEKVLIHYSNSEKDSLKFKAARFLIKNMVYKYGFEGQQLEQYDSAFSELSGNQKEKDSLWKSISFNYGVLLKSDLNVKPDLQNVSASFLIDNIDNAFKAWSFPWCKDLSFKDFCEYILPYRLMDEKLAPWRSQILERYNEKVDSLKSAKMTNVYEVCEDINNDLTGLWSYSHVFTYPVGMTYENLMKVRMGSCTHNTSLAIFVMRSLGVPVSFEEVPQYSNRNLGHQFNGLIDSNGKFIDFEIGNNKLGDVIEARNRWNFRIPKIYRHTYKVNDSSLAQIEKEEDIPTYFKQPHIKDVTATYIPVTDITVNIQFSSPEKTNYIYLCVFDNKKWVPIAWSLLKGDKAIFKDLGVNSLYMPMYYFQGRLIPASYPIIVDRNKEKNEIVLNQQVTDIKLKRKYFPHHALQGKQVGGKFQLSNSIDFKRSVDIYEFKDDSLELIPQEIKVEEKGNYRYARYIYRSGNEGDLAEVSFYSNGNEIDGEIIVSDNISNDESIKNAFDNNPLTYFNTGMKNKDQWIGLDFGNHEEVTKIKFCPRTDKNYIWPGLHYELFYWDSGWESLGVKKAENYYLDYQSPVSGALFLLRCIDEGKEERIFTIENGKQVWW